MRLPISNQQQPGPYNVPFTHNKSVTERRTEDDNHANSSTVT